MRESKYPKEYNLNFYERLIFQTIFPPTDGKGHYAEMVLRDKVIDKLVSPEERKLRQVAPIWKCPKCGKEVKSDKAPECSECKVGMVSSNRIGWETLNEGVVIPDMKTISFGEMTINTITKTLKELDEAGALGAEHRSLYHKIVLDGTEPEIEA